MKSDQLFEKFLVETRLSRQFLSNVRKFPLRSLSARPSGLGRLVNLDSVDYISGSFSWRDTPEGVDYWYLVDATWIDFLKGTLSFDEAKIRIRSIRNLVAGSSR